MSEVYDPDEFDPDELIAVLDGVISGLKEAIEVRDWPEALRLDRELSGFCEALGCPDQWPLSEVEKRRVEIEALMESKGRSLPE